MPPVSRSELRAQLTGPSKGTGPVPAQSVRGLLAELLLVGPGETAEVGKPPPVRYLGDRALPRGGYQEVVPHPVESALSKIGQR